MVFISPILGKTICNEMFNLSEEASDDLYQSLDKIINFSRKMVWTMSKKLIPLVEKYADSKLVLSTVANAPKVTEGSISELENICEHNRVDTKQFNR